MRLGSMRFGPLRLLLLLILLLAGGLAWMWVDQYGQLRNLTWVAPKALPPDIKVPAGPPKVGSIDGEAPLFVAILERPLFAPDRRPPPPPPPPTPPPPPDPLASIQILGIFSGESAGIIARIEGKMRRVKINETIGPWTLKSIDGRNVTFAQGDESRQLRLAYARLDTAVPQVTATATQAPGGTVSGASSTPQRVQDETRDRIRRLNESRASRGLPPLNY